MGQLRLLPDAAYIPFALHKLKLFVLELVSVNEKPIRVAARVSGRSLAGSAGSNPAGDMDVFLL